MANHQYLIAQEEWDQKKLLQLKDEIIKPRNSIQSYDITIDSNLSNNNSGTYSNLIKIRKEGDKIYSEINYKYQNTRRISIQNGDYQGYKFKYDFIAGQDVSVGGFEKGEFTKNDYFRYPIESLGLLPLDRLNSLYNQSHLDEFYTSVFSASPKITREKLGQTDCLVLSTQQKIHPNNESTYKVWISLEQGPSVLQIQKQFGKKTYTRKNQIEKHIPSGIWFPISSEYTYSENGNLIETEKVEIVIHSLNQRIDPSLFTIAGIGLPEGTKILHDPTAKGHTLVVDRDRNITKMAPIPFDIKPAMPEPKEPSKWWGRVAVAACVLTLIFGFIYLRQRRLKAKST
jgi:hypothetical protein